MPWSRIPTLLAAWPGVHLVVTADFLYLSKWIVFTLLRIYCPNLLEAFVPVLNCIKPSCEVGLLPHLILDGSLGYRMAS